MIQKRFLPKSFARDIAFSEKKYSWYIAIAVVASALGYFVDMYDVYLFNVVRTESLTSLGVAERDLLNTGISIIDWTFAGMVIGGVVWGIMGDRSGRIKILFGSIIIYSISTLATSYVETVTQYKLARFIAGFGLAGELGAGMTLVCELMKPSKRGYGTMVIAAVGVNGIVFASLVAHYFYWRTSYLIGSCMGVLLLLLRISVSESGLFEKSQNETNIKRGSFIMLLSKKNLLLKYLKVILIGLPILFISGVMVTGAPEFGKHFAMRQLPNAGTALAVYYASVSGGGLLTSVISQQLKSRRKAIHLVLFIQLAAVLWFLYVPPQTLLGFYARCGAVGAGYFPVLMTTASEQFGTNIRATATTSVPNFIRASFIPLSFIFKLIKPSLGLINAAGIVAITAILVSAVCAYYTQETFGRDLEFYDN